MPLYEYRCEDDHYFTRFLPVKQYKEPQNCDCGKGAVKLLSTPMIAPQFEPYESPITGKPIMSKKARVEDMKRHDCVEYEPSIREETNRKLRNEELKLEKSIDECVDAQVASMTSREQEKLEENLKAGADIEYTRS